MGIGVTIFPLRCEREEMRFVYFYCWQSQPGFCCVSACCLSAGSWDRNLWMPRVGWHTYARCWEGLTSSGRFSRTFCQLHYWIKKGFRTESRSRNKMNFLISQKAELQKGGWGLLWTEPVVPQILQHAMWEVNLNSQGLCFCVSKLMSSVFPVAEYAFWSVFTVLNFCL